MTRNFYVFDCETVPLSPSEIAEAIPDFDPAEIKVGNLGLQKAAEKIEAKRLEHHNRILERAALSPLTGRVAAIGIRGPARADGEIDERTDFNDNEETLIRSFFLALVSDLDGVWIGFNIANFDIPFLMRRAWRLGIEPPRGIFKGRYLSNWFIDLAQVWQAGEHRPEPISLNRLGQFLGLGVKMDNGANFASLLYQDQETAQAYLQRDLYLTWKIAERLGVFSSQESISNAEESRERTLDDGKSAGQTSEALVFW
jgi:hypothetical protein